jgi:hypothetical protein
MRTLLGLAVSVAVLASAGCATYASARLDDSDAAARAPEVFGEIEKMEFGKSVQVTLPAELVVADVVGRVSGAHEATSDRRGVELTEALAADKATFSDVEPLFAERGAGGIDALRAAASRHHAQLLIVTSMTEQVKDDNGVLPLLHLLVVPCFVVPTQTDDLVLHLRAAVIDVRNGLVYATFEDHRRERVHATLAGEKEAVEDAFDRLYADSLAKMKTRVADRLKTLSTATN